MIGDTYDRMASRQHRGTCASADLDRDEDSEEKLIDARNGGDVLRRLQQECIALLQSSWNHYTKVNYSMRQLSWLAASAHASAHVLKTLPRRTG